MTIFHLHQHFHLLCPHHHLLHPLTMTSFLTCSSNFIWTSLQIWQSCQSSSRACPSFKQSEMHLLMMVLDSLVRLLNSFAICPKPLSISTITTLNLPSQCLLHSNIHLKVCTRKFRDQLSSAFQMPNFQVFIKQSTSSLISVESHPLSKICASILVLHMSALLPTLTLVRNALSHGTIRSNSTGATEE